MSLPISGPGRRSSGEDYPAAIENTPDHSEPRTNEQLSINPSERSIEDVFRKGVGREAKDAMYMIGRACSRVEETFFTTHSTSKEVQQSRITIKIDAPKTTEPAMPETVATAIAMQQLTVPFLDPSNKDDRANQTSEKLGSCPNQK